MSVASLPNCTVRTIFCVWLTWIVGFARRLSSPSRTMLINGESDSGGNPANCWTQLTPFTASSAAALEAVKALMNWRYRANSASLAGTTSKPSYFWAHLFHLKNALTYLLVVETALLNRIVDFSASARALYSGFWNFSKVLHIPLPNTSAQTARPMAQATQPSDTTPMGLATLAMTDIAPHMDLTHGPYGLGHSGHDT